MSRRSLETSGPDADALREPVADAQLLGRLDQRGHDALVRAADRHEHGARHAALARGAEGRADDVVDRLVDHGVGHDDHVVLGAAERLHALAGARGALVDELRDGGRADERDAGDAGVVADALDDLAAAVHEVDHARRQQLDVVDQLEDRLLRERHLLGGLEHERIAAGHGERQEPHGHHGREVEGADGPEDADRLPVGLAVDVRRDVLEVAALHRGGHRRGALDHLDRAADLGEGVRQRLAHVLRDQVGEALLVLDERLAQREHAARALDRGRAAPGREGLLGRAHGVVEVGRRGERHARQQRARRRLRDIQVLARGGLDEASADVVAQRADFDRVRRLRGGRSAHPDPPLWAVQAQDTPTRGARRGGRSDTLSVSKSYLIPSRRRGRLKGRA